MAFDRTGIYLAPGQSIISDTGNFYKIIEYKGRGGNAVVFKVMCSSGDNRGLIFALKVQYNLSTPARRERFLEETKFLKNCTHPAILNHIDDGTYSFPNGRTFPFVIINYLPNTLNSILGSESLDFSRKVQIACQLLSAVKYLQSHNILHRDIKPSNIFLNNNDVYLGDFGLMKKLNYIGTDNEDDIQLLNDAIKVDIGELIGYVAMPKRYRTPELVKYARHEDVLRLESDIFQLGLVFAEIFTGDNPLREADTIMAPVFLNRIGNITGTEHGGLVFNHLRGMLVEDYARRTSIDDLLSRFTWLYENISIRL